MKVYLNPKRIKQENFDFIVGKFPNLIFETNIEKSYDCEVIIVDPHYVTESNILKYSNLKWIQLYTAGYDTINLDFIKSMRIQMTNAKDIYSVPIAEDVVAKILMINRNVKHYLKAMENRSWQPIYNEPEINNSVVGIIGVGSIGQEIAKRMKAFNTTIIGYRRNKGEVEYFDEILTGVEGLDELLKRSDYIILALALNKASKELITHEKFNLMKRNAVLINIARGEIIVQEDLVAALKNHLIRAAAIDVMTPEPLPSDHEMWELENIYITPHVSASSEYTLKRLRDLFIININNYLKKEKLINQINE